MSTENFIITKISQGRRENIEDIAVQEVPFTINIGDKELITLLCTPSDLEDLVTGFLFTSGLIKKSDEVKSIVLNKQQWLSYVELDGDCKYEDLLFKRLYTSGCGRGIMFYNTFDIMNRAKISSAVKIKSGGIFSLMAQFQKSSEIYLKTGGTHSAAITDGESILVFREDIGRHNAIDKAIGCMINKTIPLKDKILITSGRISSEVIFKAHKCGMPAVISRSAPTNQAIKIAREMDITLIGFARGARLNVYSFAERIL